MAIQNTSGAYTWTQSAIQIITAAHRLAQVIGEEETLSGYQLENGMDTLNAMAKGWQASDVHVWLQEDATLFLQPGQATYQLGYGSPDFAAPTSSIDQTALTATAAPSATSLTVASIAGISNGETIGVVLDSGAIFWTTVNGAPSGVTVVITTGLPSQATSGNVLFAFPTPLSRPLKVYGGRLYTPSTGSEVPLLPLSRLDYANLTDKTSVTGPVVQYFFDPQTGQGVYTQLTALFNVNPAPTSAAQTVRFTAQRPIQDFSTLANIPDFPAEWLVALKWNLSLEIAPAYGVPSEQVQILASQAKRWFDMATAWDKEQRGTTVFPFSQAVYQLIARSLRICHATGPQDVPSYGLVMNAFSALNAMVQAWQASGIHLWCEEEAILFPQAAQVQYKIGGTTSDHACLFTQLYQGQLADNADTGDTTITLGSAFPSNTGTNLFPANGDNIGIQLDNGQNFWTTVNGAPAGNVVTLTSPLPAPATAPAIVFDYPAALIRPLRCYTGRRYTYLNQIDIPMLAFSRTDYAMQPNKYTPGVITQYFFDPQLGSALLNMWPSPVDNQSGFRFTAQRPLTTFASLTSAQDFPAEWTDALVYNLAFNLAPEYSTPDNPFFSGQEFQSLQLLSAQKLQMAQAWDREPEGIRFGVAMQPSLRRGAA